MAKANDSAAIERARPLVMQIAQGSHDAFPELMAALWEPCIALVRARRTSKLAAEASDDASEVATRVMTKLQQDSFRALHSYVDWQGRHPDKAFADWFRIVVSNALRDFTRERAGTSSGRATGEPSAKRLLNEMAEVLVPDELGVRPPMTDAQTARQLLDFARARLTAAQLGALEGWLRGEDFAAIARAQGLADGTSAKKLVRAGVAVLRREFEAPRG